MTRRHGQLRSARRPGRAQHGYAEVQVTVIFAHGDLARPARINLENADPVARACPQRGEMLAGFQAAQGDDGVSHLHLGADPGRLVRKNKAGQGFGIGARPRR